MKKLVLIILILILKINAFSQENIIGIQYNFDFSPSKDYYENNIKIWNHDLLVGYNKTFLNNLNFNFNLNYKKFNYNYSSMSENFNLYSYNLNVAISKYFENFGIYFDPCLKFNSDNNSLSKSNLNFEFYSTLMFRFSPKFTIKLGLYYKDEFKEESSLYIPIIGFDWNITEKLSFNAFLPFNADIKYKINEKYTVGLDYNINFDIYEIENQQNNNFFNGIFTCNLFFEYSPIKKLTLLACSGFISNFFHYKYSYDCSYLGIEPPHYDFHDYFDIKNSYHFQIGLKYKFFE